MMLNPRENSVVEAELAHRIKNPLTVLALQLDEISSEASEESIKLLAELAKHQITRIAILVDNTLNHWRHATHSEVVEICLTELLSVTVSNWSKLFEQVDRNIKFDSKKFLIAFGRSEIIEQALDVLLENSLKHGSGQTEIKLLKNKSWAIIEIADEGSGVSPELSKKLMTHGATTTGNGIGLAWAKNEISLDGGKLELHLAKPAVFRIFLKLTPI